MEFRPVVYEHAASFLGKSPWEVSRDSELLFLAHAAAFEKYAHVPIVVGIDIYNLEVEAYGATVDEPNVNTVPSLSDHLCGSVAEINNLRPLDPSSDGRIPMIIDTAEKLASRYPACEVKVPVSGPFSIASNLVGLNKLLYDIIEDGDSVKNSLYHIVESQVAFCDAAVSAGVSIAVFESAAAPPILSPDLFEHSVYPALSEMIREASNITGSQIGCVMGGNTEPIIDMIVDAGVSLVICPGETNQQKFMNRMQKYPDVYVRVNMNPLVFIPGHEHNLEKEVLDKFKIANQRKGTSIGTGVLPYEASPDLVLKAADHVASLSAEQDR